MTISKLTTFNNKTQVNLSLTNNRLNFLFYTSEDKLFLKYFLNGFNTSYRNKLIFFKNLPANRYASILNQFNRVFEKIFFFQYSSFSKLHMIGLGFKNFVIKNQLYILVGDCNYLIFDIPKTLKIFCKKNQIYVLSLDGKEAFDFISHIKKIKKPNFYKGKGVLEFRNFKFTKLKVGKKQRFM